MLSNYGEGEENAFKRLQKELKESSAETTDAESLENVHWLVPRPVNSLFTGRSQLIDRIQGALSDDGTSTTKQKRLVITGIGGMGKSEVCLKIADLMREAFWGVFWVDVDTESTAKNGFVTVARALGFFSAESVDESLRALASTKRRWLLILDNADDPELDYTRYLPPGTKGTVIITSRIPQCSRYSTVPAEALEGLNEQHSAQLLLKAARVPEQSWQSCRKHAEDIVHLLGSHTLALVQAGAYIAEGHCQLDEYPKVYNRQRERLHRHYSKQEQSRYGGVYATFDASADVLQSSDTNVGQDALDLLAVLSMLHSSMLPLEIFKEAWHDARRLLQAKPHEMNKPYELRSWHVSKLPEFIDVQMEDWDNYRLNKASALLVSLSLVTRHSLGRIGGLSMHPLAHAWAKDRLQPEQQCQAWVTAGCVLALSHRVAWSKVWQVHERELRPHMQSFLSSSVETVISFGSLEEILPILLQCGWTLKSMREDKSLEALLQELYEILHITPSYPSEGHVLIWGLAARNLLDTGHQRQAIALMEHVGKVHKTTLEETHPGRLASQHGLASAYQANGQIREAVTLLEHVVNVRKTTLEETHPDRLASQHELARAYQANGQIREAVTLLEHVVSVRKTTLEETHPDRLASQHTLASAYQDNGQIREAVTLLEHVVNVRKTTLEETHPDRLASQHTLASAYQANGQIREAIALLEHVVSVHKTTLEETHPNRLASQHELARAYQDNGQIREAVALLEYVVKVKTTLEETHPSRLASQHELARAYQANGQIREAVALLEHVVKVETTLEETHPDRLASQHELASAYQANGQIREAVALLEHVVNVRKTTLEETHPDRLASQHALARAYWASGLAKEAVTLMEHVVKLKRTTMGVDHPSRKVSEQWLSYMHNQLEGQTT
ncbi:hypothetical protein BKA66DRAFT_420258 [Pyrenochaeta sp. MPI-SDFR-AT-0127]|nr:hypothetical protein BKA66DRAFT_420258 [Pyrenochaeta sp. MPI-SDFR-AT-0127]